MADVNVPVLGKIPGPTLIIGIVAATGLIVYSAYKHKQTQQTQANDAQAISDSGIDPNTGVPYDQEYGYGYGAAGASGIYPGDLGYYDVASGQYLGTGVGVSTVTQVSTNAGWVQAAQAYLVAQGFDPQTVATALGKYITGQALTSGEQVIVEAAIGAEQYPPQAGANGHPPALNTAPPAGQTSGGGAAGGGQNKPVTPTGLHTSNVTQTAMTLSWNKVPNATSYFVDVTYQSQRIWSRLVSTPTVRITGLTHNHTYGLHVAARNNAGSSPSAYLTQRTR